MIKWDKYNNTTDSNKVMMHNQREKQNTIRNSKLQMSIKPFILSRQDLGKSKSVDKTRKGISRVVQTNQVITNSASTLQGTPFSYNFHSSQPQLHQNRNTQPISTVGQSQLQPNSHAQSAQAKNMDLQYKIQLLQKQLVVVQRQNAELMAKAQKWQQKCAQLYECNKHMNNKINDMQTQLIYTNKCIQDKQQLIRLKEIYIQQLNNKQQTHPTDNHKINQLYDTIRQLTTELDRSTNKIYQLQRQRTMLKTSLQQNTNRQKNTIKQTQLSNNNQISQLIKTIEQYKEEKIDRTQSYRQLLIKNSMLTQEKENMQAKSKSLAYQLACEQQKTRKVMESIDQLEQDLKNAEEEAVLARAYRKQLAQFDQIKLQNNELHVKLRQFQLRIKQLDQRRLNQIQFHQQQIRRINSNQSHKYQSIIQSYKHQRDVALKQLSSLKNTNKQSQNKHSQIIEDMNKQYQALVLQLKAKLSGILQQKDNLHKIHQLKITQKQKQINDLVTKLNEIREDNNFLINKIAQNKNKPPLPVQIAYRSRSPARRSRETSPINNKDQSANFKSNYLEIKTLEEKNKDINIKLSEYEVQFIKLQDKIHIYQIQAEKSKSEQQINDRKIKHLTQQIEHFKSDKNKTIQQKIKLVQQVQSLKLQYKNKQIDVMGLQQKCKQYSQRIQQLNRKQKQYVQFMDDVNIKIEAQNQMMVNQRVELDSIKDKKQQLQKIAITNTNTMQKLSEQLKTKQMQILKYKECIGVMKQQNNLNKQKLLVKQYLTQKQECEQKQGRLAMYKQYFIILGADIEVGQLSQNQVLGMLNKLIRISIEKKIQLEMKVTKMEIQYKQSVQTQNATRILAQKYHQKCLQLEKLLIRMQQAHNEKILLVKQDYDVVYAKYLKYRNIVVTKNLEKDQAKQKK